MMTRLVCIVNSKTPAEMIVFWRDDIPSDWTGLPGLDRRVAAVVPLPGSSPVNSTFAAVENSPVAYGYGIACGQYNGFLGQGCPTAKGLYKLEWDPGSNSMNLMWNRNDINLNNVLMYSRPDNLIYGSGREDDCDFYYYGIDWETGNTSKRFRLGSESYFDDPGDANIILEDGSIVVNTRERLVQIYPGRPLSTSVSSAEDLDDSYLIFPNPFSDELYVSLESGRREDAVLTILDAKGALIEQRDLREEPRLTLGHLVPGIYFLRIENGKRPAFYKVVKK